MPDNLSFKRDRVVDIVKADGPLLPINIAKKLDLNTTFASAILSELVDNKILMITNVKCGGSPFYYVKGQELKLQELMKHLNDKDVNTAELLKKEKILRDRDLDTLKRFGLRQMKDFAVPVKVTANNNTDLFWKWYLADDKEVNDLIGKYLEARISESTGKKDEAKIPETQDRVGIKDIKGQVRLEQIYEQELKKEKKPTEKPETKIETEIVETEKVKPAKEEKIKIKPETKTKSEPVKLKTTREGRVKKEKLEEKQHEERQNEEEKIGLEDKNYDPLGRFLIDNKIDIMDQKIIKKNKEINYIAGINTEVGKGVFFLKYKAKGKINEADLSLAMHEAGRLPLILLSTGELTNKARELLGAEFKGVIFKKI